MTDGVLERIDDLERRVSELQAELRDLRATVVKPEPSAQPRPPRPLTAAAGQRAARVTPQAPATPKQPSRWARKLDLPDVDLAALLGARGLALAGGVVTLLGVVFFFVLAVNRGWIGPAERVALGALASLLLVGSGVLMRHRYGQLHSAVAAVGAGIAGGYATLLAAAALYGLVPDLLALAIAVVIAAIGTAVALAWNSETVASLGLVGATLVPLAHALDTDIGTLGTAFAVVVFAGTAVVAVRRGWDVLLAAGAAAALPQVAWLVVDAEGDATAQVVAVATAFWLLVLAAGLARREARSGDETERLSTAFVLGSTLVSGISARVLFERDLAEGTALTVAAIAYLALAAGWFARDRDLSALLGAIGLAVGAVATAELLGGGTLAVAFAAQAAVLAWVAYRLVEPRYGFLTLGYLGLAVGHALLVDAHPRELFETAAHPAADAFAPAAAGLAALVVAFYALRWKRAGDGKPEGLIDELAGDLVEGRRTIALLAAGTGAALLVHAASLALLELGTALGSFDWGEVAVTAFWGAIAAASLVAGRRQREAELYGVAWAVVAIAKLVLYDANQLDSTQAGVSALALAAGLLTGAMLTRSHVVAVWLVPVAAAVAAGGAVSLGGSSTSEGIWLLAVAAPFAALATVRWRDRSPATALWASALGLGLLASAFLLEHTELVVAWAIAAAALAALAEATAERRLQLGAYAFAALALGYSLTVLAPPAELFAKQLHPADGVLAVLFALGALVAVTWRVWETPERDELDLRLAEAQKDARPYALAAAGLLAVYAASLSILGLAQELGPDVTTAFQRGHTAVSALWGAIGLVTLYVALIRGSSSLRIAGFAVFGVSLAKLFLYDLRTLSSVTRALSFLAVGAVLLLAGFFYQRLAADSGLRESNP